MREYLARQRPAGCTVETPAQANGPGITQIEQVSRAKLTVPRMAMCAAAELADRAAPALHQRLRPRASPYDLALAFLRPPTLQDSNSNMTSPIYHHETQLVAVRIGPRRASNRP